MKFLSYFLILKVTFLVSCNDVEFDAGSTALASKTQSTDSEQSDPNFNEDNEYIDNSSSGAQLATIISDLLSSEQIGEQGEAVNSDQVCLSVEDISACYKGERSEVFLGDSFERSAIVSPEASLFGWRAVINDNGKVIEGTSGNNVEFKSYDNSILGEPSNGSKSLYFTGRAGAGSVHNLYLITESFDLSNANGLVYFSFDYLPIGLEEGEYLKLEVCNDTLENCGVGADITVDGLNGRHWKTIFQSNGKEARSNLNGFNHLQSDWINKQLSIRLDGFQRDNFVFRLNAFMNEGFYNNNPNQGVDDAIGIDNFKAFTFLTE